jgi:hypothetical protein
MRCRASPPRHPRSRPCPGPLRRGHGVTPRPQRRGASPHNAASCGGKARLILRRKGAPRGVAVAGMPRLHHVGAYDSGEGHSRGRLGAGCGAWSVGSWDREESANRGGGPCPQDRVLSPANTEGLPTPAPGLRGPEPGRWIPARAPRNPGPDRSRPVRRSCSGNSTGWPTGCGCSGPGSPDVGTMRGRPRCVGPCRSLPISGPRRRTGCDATFPCSVRTRSPTRYSSSAMMSSPQAPSSPSAGPMTCWWPCVVRYDRTSLARAIGWSGAGTGVRTGPPGPGPPRAGGQLSRS